MSNLNFVIRVPDSFAAERSYIVHVIFKEFLGLEYRIVQDPELRSAYQISADNKSIKFSDAFFSCAEKSGNYLLEELIPSKIAFSSNLFSEQTELPLLYGDDSLKVEDDSIECGRDLFAEVFFMLTRWEEFVIKDRDTLGRFPASSSIAYKFNFLHRPVVNEWLQMFRRMVNHLYPAYVFKNPQPYGITFTHDIDFLNAPTSLREFAKDVVKRKSAQALITRLGYLTFKKNPYDLFDLFMNASEARNSKAEFYFMTGHNVPGKDGQSYNKSILYRKTLKHITERGHIIGFHPSLLSFNNPAMFAQEKAKLETDAGVKVERGRQHALRFECPDTWQMWDDNNMQVDSTLGYSAMEGFRCGTGNTFTIFNIKSRRMLRLKEMPLVLMDTTLHVNRRLPVNEAAQVIQAYINASRLHDMPVTMLFHNLLHDNIDWKGWKEAYSELFIRGNS